ncbi:DUF547 domain-containing protein [Marivirga sp. S37H4]|uniref:DUF547 domain-containing protein n=1 Tax=Marivirga aurantiaca TaxID=2802615 RepID=A0A934WX26_9BACT|nr:DUF547 domain-containing protein [Marivirga aurantiaca]MBK6264693.1 DUF547 domain-containing protein [Marivirga aurantiaca]
MKHLINSFLVLILATHSLFAFRQDINNFNQQADKFLSKYVMKGNVDYKKLKENFTEIDNLYKSISTVNVKNISDNELKAFYINAYNIIVIHQITEYYPLKSALDRNGFFDKVKHDVAGERLTLDQIEKGKVILKFRDPRVHFAFSCAAAGCPELANFAFTPEKLEAQLEKRSANSINNPDFIRVDPDKKEVGLSMIFKWYGKEFTEENDNILAYLNKYRTNKIPDNYSVVFYPYDWTLNAQ